MSTGIDGPLPSKTSCSSRHTIPLFSLHDLSAFDHDPEVEDSLKTFPFASDSCSDTEATTDYDTDSEGAVPDLLSCESSTSSSDSSGSDHQLSRSVSPAKVPDFIQVLPDTPSVPTPPAVLAALHQLNHDLIELDILMVEHYDQLRISSVHLSRVLPPRGHIDGGALASTTDRKDYLWSYREFDTAARSRAPRLRVADDTVHVPTGIGYSCIPTHHSGRHVFVPTYFTPEIPATILSPYALGKALDCNGYQTFSDFHNDHAQLTLVDCSYCHSDVQFDLQLIRGLLFTDSLVAPTSSQRSSTSPPISDLENLVPPTFETPFCPPPFRRAAEFLLGLLLYLESPVLCYCSSNN